MKFFNSSTNFESVLKKYFSFKNETLSLEPFAEFLESIKKADFTDVLNFLRSNPHFAENFKNYIHNIFKGRPFNLSLTEANILSENAFFPELKKRILNKVLPPVENEKTVWYMIDNVSLRPKTDLRYMHNLPENEMDEFLVMLGASDFIIKPNIKKELIFSMNILSWRVTGMAMEVEVVRMAPQYRNLDNPFLALQNELEALAEDLTTDPDLQLHSKDSRYKQIKIYTEQCLEFVNIAFKNSAKYGISGKINQSLLKIRQQTERIYEIVQLLVIDTDEDVMIKSKQLIFNILNYKSHKNNIADLINDSTRLISHLITNHTAEAGTHYITSTRKEYMTMFYKASGGGIIVGALCVLKMLYGYIPGSDFSHAFLYSMNYAMGFVMIYLMGFTLATKQPAMTAATMTKVLSEEGNSKRHNAEFAHLVSKLFRSQFIAFVGNVLLAFPIALAIIYGLDVFFSQNLAVDRSDKLLKDLDPFKSKAILHASIAGFYLFISGIISGNIGNNSVFYQIPERIAKNLSIRSFFGKKFAKGLSKYYAKNWPGIVSNFWFGVFLGATAPVGMFFGLDLDIRHITFAAGNFALGLYGKDFSVDSYTFWMSFFTVFLIGFFNFLVSFSLSMFLAFRSRKMNFGQVSEIYKEIFRYFAKHPLKFFLPLSSGLDKKADDLMSNTISNKSEEH
ncbi:MULTISPECIES: recombinase [Chryseobacterium]|jgi:site-specific recombinase|uniref:Recombinase n=1 Tax=Chryseobacterium rhizosphaerae TaxID=395937 RepID=A0ABX9INB6_9FLAO|nr:MULTISPECIES: recombinase [Chryseobacterium]MBL3549883.1 recombinase [Chryseobacterium sp. KMC2]MDC8099498.1 site-specific recombinase [Chryseobacterium rhizosphaerae]MDR6546445.1 site-specific recombinase [Chryseobacterium rhizosphaerae]REC77034.1 recombinase [Chryseobacterium rhizosphaerae]SMC97302.1 Site-specific recombinase [Chryseobacterium sp. YR221]